jgi:transcriptional regulator with XRE-family HTH domain
MDLALLTGLSFKEALRQIRMTAGYSQVKLAQELGIAQPVVSAWEQGEHYPTMARLALLEQLFHLQPGTLLVRAAYEMLNNS